MTIQEFIRKYTGTQPDFDGSYPGQCVDLYRLYLKEVLGLQQSPPVKGAAEIWNTYRQQDFIRIPNTYWGLPKAGDIVIFKPFPGNPYGHVCIALSGANLWRFTSFDSNWSIPTHAKEEVHNYKFVLGWLRRR